jgi:glycosyltransferase involved in cell wall biosynthesis
MSFRIMQVLHQGGGAGSVTSTLHLSIGLAKLGHHVLFVCPPDSEVEAGARQAGLDVRPLSQPPHARRKNAAALLTLLQRDRPVLINSQSARDRQALTWLGLTGRLKVPAVFTRRQMPLTFWLENWLASRAATRIVAVSQAVADALVRKGTPRSKLVVIHNGLVTDRIDRLVSPADLDRWRERIGWRPDEVTAGIVARRKDQVVVLRGLARVEIPIHLVMAGVEATGELALAAREVPERHRVTFVPFDSDVRPLYDLVDLVLLPSRMEGLSQALLEAMALGKPVAVSAATGNLEVVTDGVDGLLVSPLDPAAWAGAITRLASDRNAAARLGDAARSTAREKFSLARTVERTEQLYRQVLADR